MTIEYTIRFTSEAAIDRTIGVVLLTSETETLHRLISGYYFLSERSPLEMIAAFEAEGFEIEDFRDFQFASK